MICKSLAKIKIGKSRCGLFPTKISETGENPVLRPFNSMHLQKDWSLNILDNWWTGLTIEGELSAHFEHSLLITKEGPLILNKLESNNNK